jgi:hypothetical protein
MTGFCECGNEPPGSVNCGKFLDLLDSQEGFSSKELVRNLTDGFQGDFSDYALGK